MDSSLAPAAAPASSLIHKGKELAKPDVPRPSRSGQQGRRVLNPPPLSSSSSFFATAAVDKKKGLLIDKGEEGAGDLSPKSEKPSRRRRKVKEGALKADVRRPLLGLRGPSSKPKKPRVSTAVAASRKKDPLVPPSERWERCLRISKEDADVKDYDWMPYDYEKREREEIEKVRLLLHFSCLVCVSVMVFCGLAVAEQLQFVERFIDASLYGIGRTRKPKPKPKELEDIPDVPPRYQLIFPVIQYEEIASDDEYLSKPPSGSYSDETLKSFLDFEIQDDHLLDPNFKKSYIFKLKKEHGYIDDRSKDSDRDETTLSQIEPGPFPLIGETAKKTGGSNDLLEENS